MTVSRSEASGLRILLRMLFTGFRELNRTKQLVKQWKLLSDGVGRPLQLEVPAGRPASADLAGAASRPASSSARQLQRFARAASKAPEQFLRRHSAAAHPWAPDTRGSSRRGRTLPGARSTR